MTTHTNTGKFLRNVFISYRRYRDCRQTDREWDTYASVAHSLFFRKTKAKWTGKKRKRKMHVGAPKPHHLFSVWHEHQLWCWEPKWTLDFSMFNAYIGTYNVLVCVCVCTTTTRKWILAREKNIDKGTTMCRTNHSLAHHRTSSISRLENRFSESENFKFTAKQRGNETQSQLMNATFEPIFTHWSKQRWKILFSICFPCVCVCVCVFCLIGEEILPFIAAAHFA